MLDAKFSFLEEKRNTSVLYCQIEGGDAARRICQNNHSPSSVPLSWRRSLSFGTGVIQSEEPTLAAAVEIGYSRASLLAWQRTCIHGQLLHKRVQRSPVTRLGCLTESFSWHISVGFLNYWFCKPENFVYISQQTVAFSLQNSTSINVCSPLDFPCWQGNIPPPLLWILFCYSHYKKKESGFSNWLHLCEIFPKQQNHSQGNTFLEPHSGYLSKKVSNAVIIVNQEIGFGNLTGLLTSQLNV